MTRFYFHGLLTDSTERVRVIVDNLDDFVQGKPGVVEDFPHAVRYEYVRDGKWFSGGVIARSCIHFDHCNTERDEHDS